VKPIIVYHKGCLDGFCAAYVAARALGDVELLPVHHGDPLPPPGQMLDRDVWMFDVTLKREDMEKLFLSNPRARVLDHHASAQRDLVALAKNYPDRVTFDLGRSGAGLAIDTFFPGERSNITPTPLALLALVVEDRDLWRFRLAGTREVCAFLRTLPMTLLDWDDGLESISDMREMGEPICAYMDELVEQIAKHAQLDDWAEGTVLIANSSVLQSEVGAKLAKESPSGVGVVWYQDGDQRRYSLRAREGGPDVSMWAKERGGGGHKASAAFSMKAPMYPIRSIGALA